MKLLVKKTVEKIKIKDLFQYLEIPEIENHVLSVPFPLYVKTPYGYNRIVSAFRTEKQQTVTTYFGNNTTLKTSENHLLKSNGEWKKIKDLNDGDFVETENSQTKITKKIQGYDEILYDISVDKVNCYYSNGILSHNSWVLTRLGAEAMRQGKNVLHFTLELNEKYVGLRYDSCFTGIDFQNIRSSVPIVKDRLSKIDGKLIIKYFPIKTVSSHTLKLHAERIMMLGTKIDLIIVDYADILRPFQSDRNSNSYSEAGGIYEELRSVAGELQVPIWTASQSNRSGMDEDVLTALNISDSYRKIMTADFVMSLSRKTNDKVSNTARFHIIKNRFGPDGMTFPSMMNAGCGDIRIYLDSSREGMAIMAKMSDADNSAKKLKSQWDSFNTKKNNEDEDY